MSDPFLDPNHVQGSVAWLAHRRDHIGASDAPIIMGESPWKTPYQLWLDKQGLSLPQEMTPAMQRGVDLEPEARAAFENEVGVSVFPQVIYHPEISFMMASMDGMSLDGSLTVEIKCPGKKAHALAMEGVIPAYYEGQLQHQMACTGASMMYYYSYDGEYGVMLEAYRNPEYIEQMIEKEQEFWDCVKSGNAPAMTDRDYVERSDREWQVRVMQMKEIDLQMSCLKERREIIKKELVAGANERSCRGGGMTLSRSFPRGRVDYSKVPELVGVDLEQYKGPPTERWTLRIDKSD